MNTKNTRLQCKENHIKLQNSLISFNLKRSGPKSRAAIKRTALGGERSSPSRGYTYLEIKPLKPLATNKFLFYKGTKKRPICFALNDEKSSLSAKKDEIQIGQRGPSVWIVYNAQKVKNNFFNAARAVFNYSSLFSNKVKPGVLETKQINQKFKSKIFFFETYKLKKHFSNIELSLRQGCQWFVIYVMGSFCWLYLVQSSKGTNSLNGSKMSFLFKEILFENLPLLSEKGLIFDETIPELSSTSQEKTILKSDDNVKNNNSTLNITERVISIELTPLLQEKLQNFIGKKFLKSENILNSTWKNSELVQNSVNQSKKFNYTFPTQELLFFARKPIFFKGLVSVFPTPLSSSPLAQEFDAKTVEAPKNEVKSILYSNGEDLSISKEQNYTPTLLQNQRLPQKKIYNLAGTSLIIDPTIDLLPRKLEGCNNQQGFKLKKAKENNYVVTLALGERNTVPSINLKPQLGLGERALWCTILKQTKKESCFGQSKLFEKNLLWGQHLTHVSKNLIQPLATGLRSRKLSKMWVKVNTFQVEEPLQSCSPFASNKWFDVMFFSHPLQSNPKSKRGASQLLVFNRSSTSNMTNMQLSQKDLVVPNIILKKKSLKNKSQKWKEFFNQPRLHSGFNFPNMPIFPKNKEKLNEGLGLSLNPQSQFFSMKEKATDYATQIQKLSFLKSSVNTTEMIQEKRLFDKNPFFAWIYKQNPTAEYLFYSRPNSKSLKLQKNTARFVILDKNTDIKITSSFLGKKFVSLLASEARHPRETTFIKKNFSGNRTVWNGLVDAPENFFGTPYLKLGERFTIEKLKGQNQIGTLYNIHNESVFIPLRLAYGTLEQGTSIASPYASTGTSLNTVFGKKRFTNSQSKKSSKIQNVIPQARLAKAWSKKALVSKTLLEDWLTKNLKDNDFYNSDQEKQKRDSLPKSNQTHKILKILSFKRISGKANRNVTLPFKYYNPGIKRERNIEDTMLVLEGFKKSRLFPTIHNSYRGIATTSLPFAIEMDKVHYAAQDIDLQSILAGMRQRTESQRIATNLSEPSNTQPTKSLENSKNSQKEETIVSNIEQNATLSGFGLQKNKKKRRLSNYYPLCTSLTVWPQTSFSQKVLGSTDIVESNFTGSFNLITNLPGKTIRGSAQTKGFYFEKLLCSKPVRNFLENGVFSPNWLSKILFFTGTWYSYKLLATPLSHSTQFLPATFTEALGLQSFQQKYRIIQSNKTRQTFKNLAGAEKTLSELRDLIWTFRLVGTGSSNRTHNFFTLFPYIGSRGGQLRRSVFAKSRNRFLLAGPPGTGKTLLVKALAAEANLPVIVQPVSGLQMISGVENPISSLFHVARQIKPCIIFLDELDTLGTDVNMSPSNSTADQKLGIRLARKYTYTLLLELDGLTSSTNDLLIIGATNRLETLNPALTRAGRFETIINFNLPSQDVRTTLFAFYLGAKKQNKELLYKNNSTLGALASRMPLSAASLALASLATPIHEKKSYLNISKKKRAQQFPFAKTETKSVVLESYLAQKSYGLSHASIETIINESALDSMLRGKGSSKPVHTVETLERAIRSVKTLTSRTTFSIFNIEDSEYSPSKNFSNQLILDSFKSEKKEDQKPVLSRSLKPFQQEFLVTRVYQIIGPLIISTKSKEKTPKLTKKTTTSPVSNLSSVQKRTHFTINKKEIPITRKDLQSCLLHEYSGIASLCIYNVTKPQTVLFLGRSGLYQNPSYVAAIILTLKLLTLQSSFFNQNLAIGNSLSWGLNYEKNIFPFKRQVTTDNWAQFSGFTSENNVNKYFVSNLSNLNAFSTNKKSSLFWKNRKIFSKFANVRFTGHNNQVPQSPLIDVKYNRLPTSWFRIYLSRPFFRYDTFHYIENKEYYPKNNYILKRNNLLRRNVSTLSHAIIDRQSLLGDLSKNRGLKVLNSVNGRYIEPLTFKNFTTVAPLGASFAKDSSKKTYVWRASLAEKKGKFFKEKQAHFEGSDFACRTSSLGWRASLAQQSDLSFKPQSKESLYLAIVASIFNKGLQFFNNNRELTDYCAYIFLRYGRLYEFYLDAILKKF